MTFRLLLLCAGLCLLVSARGASARGLNLLPNGSFEKGFARWEVSGAAEIVPGRCGPHAAGIEGSVLRARGIVLQRGQIYKLTFRFLGALAVSTVPGRLFASRWTKFTHTVTPKRTHSLRFRGVTGDAGHIDCIRLVSINQ